MVGIFPNRLRPEKLPGTWAFSAGAGLIWRPGSHVHRFHSAGSRLSATISPLNANTRSFEVFGATPTIRLCPTGRVCIRFSQRAGVSTSEVFFTNIYIWESDTRSRALDQFAGTNPGLLLRLPAHRDDGTGRHGPQLLVEESITPAAKGRIRAAEEGPGGTSAFSSGQMVDWFTRLGAATPIS